MLKHLLVVALALCFTHSFAQTPFRHDLQFNALAQKWDEALPLGNAMVGNLIWQKDGKLRFSLDRADLWDLRPTKDLDKLTFKMVQEQVAKNDYRIIQELGDLPYERDPAPSKIPGAALEFNIEQLGEVDSVRLYIRQGVAMVKWKNGARLTTFIHASRAMGWYRFENAALTPTLVPPRYEGSDLNNSNSVEGQGLARLGYKQGQVITTENSVDYLQEGWNGFSYKVSVQWEKNKKGIEGAWSITSNSKYNEPEKDAKKETELALKRGFKKDYDETITWWRTYWNQSSLSVPDSLLERQWYLENYKFACVARENTPPVTLQAIWTADNGNLPPWKGDIHNDLNTQLSYWPAYSGNHLKQASGFTNWLWQCMPVFKKYTQHYFGVAGLNVPGVTTLEGKEMGGWIQYSCSPTVAGWLAHHFYLEWKYSADRNFLSQRAYPWLSETATFFDNLADFKNGYKKLPLSSSPEINDNLISAWFDETTNYDLAIIRWTYSKAAELAEELNKTEEAKHWRDQLLKWPELNLDSEGSLSIAPNFPLKESHRHFSHMMAFHPLGTLDYSNPNDKEIIDATMRVLERNGTMNWVGYSFSWQANMYARMKQGEKAAETLKKFASCFVLPNGFHVNGDQCEGKYSSYRYRPFTLEGNFAYAAALQEMLLQSHSGVIEVFPAIPAAWKNVSFYQLRAEGGFVISASMEDGKTNLVSVWSEAGGTLKIKNVFSNLKLEKIPYEIKDGIIYIQAEPNQRISLMEKTD